MEGIVHLCSVKHTLCSFWSFQRPVDDHEFCVWKYVTIATNLWPYLGLALIYYRDQGATFKSIT